MYLLYYLQPYVYKTEKYGKKFKRLVLADSAKVLLKHINILDELLRSQPNTKRIVDNSFSVESHLGMADWYISTAYGKPSATASAYLDNAITKLSEGG
jgi:hypothetical protein